MQRWRSEGEEKTNLALQRISPRVILGANPHGDGDSVLEKLPPGAKG
jgi:hypothetical protein